MIAALTTLLVALAGAQQAPLPAVAFGVPLIDLAHDAARQVVVDREAGQYLGHPTTVLLEDGRTMICVYPQGHGKGAIVMKRSEDGGLTWSERLPTPESWATSKETPTIHRVVAADGTKRLILFSGLHPIRMAVSEDDGARWSELEPIGDFGGIVAMASVAQVGAPGRYAAWFHDDGRFFGPEPVEDAGFDVYQTLSEDGGLTWGAPVSIASLPDVQLCEPGFLRSLDGARIALFLRENSRTKNSHVIFSEDEGASWSEPLELPPALTGDRHVARTTPDRRLVVTFRDTAAGSPTQGDWMVWIGSWHNVEQRTPGGYRVRLMDNRHAWDCAYPGLELLPDGTFVATTYGHWTEGEEPYIVSVRFRVADLDELLLTGSIR